MATIASTIRSRWSRRCTREARVVVALAIVVGLDSDVVRLAFDDDERTLLVGLVFDRAPDDKICAGVTRATTRDFNLLVHLVQSEAVFIDQDTEVFLTDSLFGSFDEPLLTDVAPDFSFFTPNR